ncbi:helix-turn-helix transcriptional regulator [Burkholderia anthina]|uniref:helix-turn-helix transcriptional regulator n=1 Tax=Burkholderia anthina TaxID=179879 RepID=UPI0009BD25AC|nr:helix-turn-helix transcriptional regulator [Burkholderia anthina]
MTTQWHEIYLGIENAKTMSDLADTASRAVSRIGFSNWLFEVKSTCSGNDSEFFSDRGQYESWIKYYKDADFLPGGSPVYAALRTKGLAEWSDGARFVLTQCSWIGADLPALFSVGREITPVRVEEKATNAPYIAWLAGAIHAKFIALSAPTPKTGDVCSLTDRERELLRWTALGNTAGEVASIVGLTTRTVYFHLKNAMLKMNATNTLQAVVKAMVLGLI